jgi:hypothetical protein
MIFEITGDHISRLSDTDLRTLIGLLCEAELRRRNTPRRRTPRLAGSKKRFAREIWRAASKPS